MHKGATHALSKIVSFVKIFAAAMLKTACLLDFVHRTNRSQ
jgi:hypothetical protein